MNNQVNQYANRHQNCKVTTPPIVGIDPILLYRHFLPSCPNCKIPIPGLWSLRWPQDLLLQAADLNRHPKEWIAYPIPVYCGVCGTPIIIHQHKGPWFTALGYRLAPENPTHMKVIHTDPVGKVPRPYGPACPYCDRLFHPASLIGLDWACDAWAEIKGPFACIGCKNQVKINRIPMPWFSVDLDRERMDGWEPDPKLEKEIEQYASDFLAFLASQKDSHEQ